MKGFGILLVKVCSRYVRKTSVVGYFETQNGLEVEEIFQKSLGAKIGYGSAFLNPYIACWHEWFWHCLCKGLQSFCAKNVRCRVVRDAKWTGSR